MGPPPEDEICVKGVGLLAQAGSPTLTASTTAAPMTRTVASAVTLRAERGRWVRCMWEWRR
jgi:hypothetical protein